MNTPKKGEIIINPKTQRPIRIGGRSWLKLVKEGVLEGRYSDPKKIAPLADNDEDIDKQIEEINQTLPRGKQAVRGRGKYRGQITTRNVKPDTEEVSRYTAKMAGKIVNDNIDELSQSDNLEEELERLILAEMANNNPKRKRGRPRKEEIKEEYELQDIEEEEEEEEEEYWDGEDIDYFE